MTRKISEFPRYNEKCEVFVETSDTVFGHGEEGRGERRTPLARQFTDARGAKSLVKRDAWRNLSRFTAIGSRTTNKDEKLHLPMLDADHGAHAEDCSLEIDGGLHPYRALHDVTSLAVGAEPTEIDGFGDDFTDALDELGVHDFQVIDTMSQSVRGKVEKSRRVSIVMPLGSVAVLDSEREGHSHVFIQVPVETEVHKALMRGFVDLGVVSTRWAYDLSSPTHGTILRTPWTPKPLDSNAIS